MKSTGGDIVRSTGRKDRHSKVYIAKGPRDRRVRLSAHTAIQFYDVQCKPNTNTFESPDPLFWLNSSGFEANYPRIGAWNNDAGTDMNRNKINNKNNI